jgi:hypothetical protein
MEELQPEEEIVLFEMPVEFDLEKSESEGRRFVSGYATTEAPDIDGESLLLKGLDWQPLQERGFINYDHQKRVIAGGKMPIIIGWPTEVKMLEKGLHVTGELMNGDPMASEQNRLANEMWELGIALKKSGGNRSLAYSIEGGVLERRGKKLVRTRATMVALTHKPVNPECSVEVFAKSFCCGKCSPDHDEYNPAHACGNKQVELVDGLPFLTKALEKAASTSNHGALLLENLDRGMSAAMYGDKDCGCFDRKTGAFHKSLTGAHEHLTKCLGHNSQDTFNFLRKIIVGSEKSADLAVLAKTAGLIRQ